MRLVVLACRLRDIMAGDVVRGVRVGLVDPEGVGGALGRAGALERVAVEWVDVYATLLMPLPRGW